MMRHFYDTSVIDRFFSRNDDNRREDGVEKKTSGDILNKLIISITVFIIEYECVCVDAYRFHNLSVLSRLIARGFFSFRL